MVKKDIRKTPKTVMRRAKSSTALRAKVGNQPRLTKKHYELAEFMAQPKILNLDNCKTSVKQFSDKGFEFEVLSRFYKGKSRKGENTRVGHRSFKIQISSLLAEKHKSARIFAILWGIAMSQIIKKYRKQWELLDSGKSLEGYTWNGLQSMIDADASAMKLMAKHPETSWKEIYKLLSETMDPDHGAVRKNQFNELKIALKIK